jgi:hypothetical protein
MPNSRQLQGTGPWLERRYFIDVARPRCTPVELMQEVQCRRAPLLAQRPGRLREEKAATDSCLLAVGDEFHISILGPWNGSVRVTAGWPRRASSSSPSKAIPKPGASASKRTTSMSRPDVLRFEICSRARSRDGLVAFAYDTLGGGKLMQEATWVEFCQPRGRGQRGPGPGRRRSRNPHSSARGR